MFFIVFTAVLLSGQIGAQDLPVFSECGGTTSALAGIITSPNYPTLYPNGVSCLWTIETPADTNVEVKITNIDIENARNCPFDYLRIAGGNTSIDAGLQFCGQTSTGEGFEDQPFVSLPPINIQFVSDVSLGGTGFRIHFEGAASRTRSSIVVVTDMDLPTSPKCSTDYVITMYLGGTRDSYRMCFPIMEGRNNMTGVGPVHFFFNAEASDEVWSKRGFYLSFQVDSPCKEEPCKNGATCLYTGSDSPYTCLCREGYTGRNCDIEINECEGVTCENRGICVDLFNDYRCNCVPGTSGTFCEVVDNPCVFEPCRNGATCSVVNGIYECECTAGYFGANCDAEINECLSVPCLNGGTCRDLFNDYRCDCRTGFIGDNCEVVVETTPPTLDPNAAVMCTVNVCKNGGRCVIVSAENTTSCICTNQFTGDNCETSVADSELSLFQTLAICAFLGMFLLLILLIVTCCCWIKKRNQYKARIKANRYNQDRFMSRQTEKSFLGSTSRPSTIRNTMQSRNSLLTRDSVTPDRFMGSGADMIPIPMTNGLSTDYRKSEATRVSSIPVNNGTANNGGTINGCIIPPHTMPLPRKDIALPGQVDDIYSASQELPKAAPGPKRQTWNPITATDIDGPDMFQATPLHQRHTTMNPPEYVPSSGMTFDNAHTRPPVHPQLHKEAHLPESRSSSVRPSINVVPPAPPAKPQVVPSVKAPKPTPSPKVNRIPNGFAEKLLKQMKKGSPTKGMPSKSSIARKSEKKPTKNRTNSATLQRDEDELEPRERLRRSEPHLKSSISIMRNSVNEPELETRNSLAKKLNNNRMNGSITKDEMAARQNPKEEIYKLNPNITRQDAFLFETSY